MKSQIQLQLNPRPELERFEPYQAGLSVDQIQRQYGLKRVVKLASNENPLGASGRAKAALKKAIGEVYRYPESHSVDLRRVIAGHFKLDIAQVLIGAGSDEIIELLAKAYLTPKDEIVVSASSFIQYRSAGDLMGARVVVVPMRGMKHDLKAMASAVTEDTKMIFIANPNNPTGTFNTRGEIDDFLKTLSDRVLPVFDEAYFEYAQTNPDYPSMIEEFMPKRPLVVLRTFSKIYGLAGLRIGYGVGPDVIIQMLNKIRPPFNVSSVAQAAAQAAFFDQDHVNKSIITNEKERDFLAGQLGKMGYKVVPSVANFLLFNVQPAAGRTIFRRLLEKGVITRAVDEYGLPDYLRVTVGTRAENKEFLKALQEVVNRS